MIASDVGVILAVKSWNSPGAIDGWTSGVNVTVQPVGALPDGVTAVIGAVPVLVTRITKSAGEPALAFVESTWLGVETPTV